MTTFVIVMLAILAANVIWTVGMFALMSNEKALCKFIDYYTKMMEGYIKKLEKKFEEGL